MSNFRIHKPRYIGAAGQSTDPIASLWQAAVIGKGGTVSDSMLVKVSKLLRGIRAYGLLSSVIDIVLLKAENSEQILTSLILLQNGTFVGAPAPIIVPNRYTLFDGSQNYLRTDLIPSVEGAAGGAASANIGLGISEWGNASSNGMHGCFVDANRALDVLPGNSTSSSSRINSNSFLYISAESALSIGLTIATRNGTTYKINKRGTDTGTVTGPSFTGNSIAAIELYVGATNNAGTAGSFRAASVCMLMLLKGDLTDTQKSSLNSLEYYYRTDVDPMDIYISDVNFGGIPVGSDSAGGGTAAAPFKTIDATYTKALTIDTLLYNGDSGSPTVYLSTSQVTDNKTITHQAINLLGAILTGSGTTAARRVGASSNSIVTYRNLLWDGDNQTSGPAQNLIYILSKAAKYKVVVDTCTLRDWDDYSAIVCYDADLRLDLEVYDCTLTNTAARGGIYLANIIEGSIIVDGGSTTITNGLGAARGPIKIVAKAAGVTADISNHDVTLTFDASISGSGINAIALLNCVRSTISDLTVIVDGTAAPTVNSHAVCISTDRGIPLEYPIDDSVIRNVVVTNNARGGSHFRMGDDSSDRTKANRCGIEYCTGTGTANFTLGGGHSAFLVWVIDGWIRHCTLTTGGIGLVNKCTLRAEIAYNTVSDHSSSLSLQKGAEYFYTHHNTLTAVTGNDNVAIAFFHEDDVTLVPSSGRFEYNTLNVDGADNVVLINAAFGSIVTFAYNEYNLLSGTLAATPFQLNGVSYTPAQWKALIEPTATGNIF